MRVVGWRWRRIMHRSGGTASAIAATDLYLAWIKNTRTALDHYRAQQRRPRPGVAKVQKSADTVKKTMHMCLLFIQIGNLTKVGHHDDVPNNGRFPSRKLNPIRWCMHIRLAFGWFGSSASTKIVIVTYVVYCRNLPSWRRRRISSKRHIFVLEWDVLFWKHSNEFPPISSLSYI